MASGNEFVQRLTSYMSSNQGLSEKEYVDLWRMYGEMGNLQKYGLSSRLTCDYPELDQSLRTSSASAGWELYRELGGTVEK